MNMGTKLTDDQCNSLKKFRDVMSDVCGPELEDHYFIPWLIARKFDLPNAQKMLREHLKWRKEWDVDNIDKWKWPDVCKKYYPVAFSGYDREGCPVWIVPYGKSDFIGLLQSCNSKDLYKLAISIMETSKRQMEQQTVKLERKIHQHTVIVDMEGMPLSLVTHKQTLQFILEQVNLVESNYPEIIKRAVFVNVPRMFSILYALVYPLLQKETVNKIMIRNSDSSVWIPELLQLIDSTVLPPEYGGTGLDPGDDDTRCLSMIHNGKVPKYYYRDSSTVIENLENKTLMLTTTVPSGKQFQLNYDVTIPNSILRYEYWLESHDIGFDVQLEDSISDGKRKRIFNVERLTRNKGDLLLEDCGKYIVTFDNSFSRFRSKTLNYFISFDQENN